MNLKRKWIAVVGAVVVAGGLTAGAAFAAEGTGGNTDTVAQAVQAGKRTQGQADVLGQLKSLRKSYNDKFKADARSLIEQAVKDGKLTREQADGMIQHISHPGKGHGLHSRGMKWQNMTQTQVKAKLDEGVKAGTLTQQQADKLMRRWQEHHKQQNQQNQQ